MAKTTLGCRKSAVSLRIENKKTELESIKTEIDYLTFKLGSDNLDPTCAANYTEMKKSEMKRYVMEVLDRGVWEQTRRRSTTGKEYKLWVTKVDGKYVTASTKDALFEKLYEMFSESGFIQGKDYFVMQNLFKDALVDKSHSSRIEGKTLEEYKRYWDKFYLTSEIARQDIRTIGAKQWKMFFTELVRKYDLTRSKLSDIRIVANILMDYCVEEEIIPYNVVRGLNLKNLPYRNSSNTRVKSKPFTEQQITKVIEWAEKELLNPRIKPLYVLAILFNLFMGLRYAELAGLRWNDVDPDNMTVLVCGQTTLKVEMDDDLNFTHKGPSRVDHTKQYVPSYPISMPEYSLGILRRIKELHLSDEYIFPRKGEFRYHTYNDRVKDAANAAGVAPEAFHTHCLRATVATEVYKTSGGDMRQVQFQLRHTTPAMSSKYVDDWWTMDAVRKTLDQTIKNCLPCLPEKEDENPEQKNAGTH